jgi:formate/nitrite transporter
MSNFLSPAEICAYTEETGIKKAALAPVRQFILGILAGAFIAFAAEGSNMAAFNLLASPDTYGLGRCVAGVVFPTGLMLVLLAGGELFTGNTLIGIAVAQKRTSISAMLRNWGWVYFGNFVGSVLLAHMMVNSGLFNSGTGLLGGVTIKIASGKESLSFLSAIYLGILCNWLVCLAVWIAYGAKDMAGKILGIFCPIWLFITSGFEHSIANMYYVPAGIMAKSNAAWAKASGLSQQALNDLTWSNFFLHNLIPVTLGNIVGGLGFVGMVYWFVYLLPAKQQKTSS